METVGSYEAKTHFAELLDKVEKGERIVITRHGHPVAAIVPLDSSSKMDRHKAIQELREFRKGKKLGGLSIREMIEEGRR